MQQFFYDAQLRRFLLQFTRIVSNFQIEYGNETDGVNQAALIAVIWINGRTWDQFFLIRFHILIPNFKKNIITKITHEYKN